MMSYKGNCLIDVSEARSKLQSCLRFCCSDDVPTYLGIGLGKAGVYEQTTCGVSQGEYYSSVSGTAGAAAADHLTGMTSSRTPGQGRKR